MVVKTTAYIIRPFLRLLDLLTPIGDLIARIWIAQIFFLDAWVKMHSWRDTVQLFAQNYHVGAATVTLIVVLEIFLSICLLLGFGGRILIFLFFIFNGILILAYNAIWTPQGYEQQFVWQIVLMLLMLHGPGKLSLDHWLLHKHRHHFFSQT
jgi:putative oxidoreductase